MNQNNSIMAWVAVSFFFGCFVLMLSLSFVSYQKLLAVLANAPTSYILSYCLSDTLLLLTIVDFVITFILGLILLVYFVIYKRTKPSNDDHGYSKWAKLNPTPTYTNGYPKWFIFLGFASLFSVLLILFIIPIAISKAMEDYHQNYEKYEVRYVKFNIFNLHSVYDEYDDNHNAGHEIACFGESGICYAQALNNFNTPIYVYKVKNLNSSAKQLLAKHLVWYRKDINKAYLAIAGESLEPTYKAFIHELMKFWYLFLGIPALYFIIIKHKTIGLKQ